MKCPTLSKAIVFADDPYLGAQVSCRLAMPGTYLPIVDGPRLSRPDAEAEVIRRNNAAARVRPDLVIFAGLPDEASQKLGEKLGWGKVRNIRTSEDVEQLPPNALVNGEPLRWGRDRIGVGLLTALRHKSSILFDDKTSPNTAVPSKSGHLVICEQGKPLAEVIAANYAFSLGAGLQLIP